MSTSCFYPQSYGATNGLFDDSLVIPSDFYFKTVWKNLISAGWESHSLREGAYSGTHIGFSGARRTPAYPVTSGITIMRQGLSGHTPCNSSTGRKPHLR